MDAKTLLADVCFFGLLGQLLSAVVHSTDSRFDSGLKWCIHVSSIVIYWHKKSLVTLKKLETTLGIVDALLFWSRVGKRGTHFEHSFFIDNCSGKMVNTLPSNIFNSSPISRITIGQNEFVEFSFKWPEHSASFETLRPRLKSAHYLCFRRSRIRITLIKSLLHVNSIFHHQKAMFYQHMKFRFFHCFVNSQQ